MSVDHVDLVTVDDKCEIRWAEAFGGDLQNRLVNRAARAELQSLLLDLIAKLDPFDREILVLRHVEELSNSEAAAELGLSKSAASKRYIRALECGPRPIRFWMTPNHERRYDRLQQCPRSR